MKALDNRFYVKFMVLEIGLLFSNARADQNTSGASLSIQVSIFFGTYNNSFSLCLLIFAE